MGIRVQAIQLSPCHTGLARQYPTTPSGTSRFPYMLLSLPPFGSGWYGDPGNSPSSSLLPREGLRHCATRRTTGLARARLGDQVDAVVMVSARARRNDVLALAYPADHGRVRCRRLLLHGVPRFAVPCRRSASPLAPAFSWGDRPYPTV